MALRCYRLLLAKTYFDTGWSFTNQVKYPLILLGFIEVEKTSNAWLTITLGILYCIFCYIVGRLYYHYKLIETQNEIGNLFNPFQKEVRKYIKRKV